MGKFTKAYDSNMPHTLPTPTPDLHATCDAIRRGMTNATAEAAKAIQLAQSDACKHVFRQYSFPTLHKAAQQHDNLHRPLAGLSVSVKDLFDMVGDTTAAGSVVLADAPAATQDCPAVARLRAAGAGFIGRTHMVEFAFSGVGTNPHFGTPAAWDALSNQPAGTQALVPGGSSSGAAVSVATGAAFIGLGSDTGGSIRIPAALNGIVGFKSTARHVPTAGAIPLSSTLDTVCALTRSVRDAILAHEILAQRRVVRSPSPLAAYRLAVVSTTFLDHLDPSIALAFERSLQTLRAAGAQIAEVALPELTELSAIQSTGGFSAAESYAWHHVLLAEKGADYDPRVSARIARGATMKAHEYIALTHARKAWIHRIEAALQGFDAVLSPTVPITAPPIAQVAPGKAHDEAFFKINTLLLRNTSIVNMLDGCAISLPCHHPGELPMGLMVWQGATCDDTVLNIALQAEYALRRKLFY
jgi:aspartyl-tRNA(Asn)/glutamyl-tRNA(Gln) amidotransferase subunit A